MTREQLFLSQLATIERVIGWVCARRGLRRADAEDFASTVKLRLIENDYEILGRFQGRSSLKTYLAVVVQRLYFDFQNQRFGKWRPSAEARRLGPLALRLEALLHRDGLSFDEACGVLQTDFGASESRDALYALSVRLPPRSRRQPEALQTAAPGDGLPTGGNGHLALEQSERQALACRTGLALRRALERLPGRDRLLLRLHFEAGLTLAQVARALGEQQKPLYRKRDALLKRLRAELEAAGIRDRDAQELLGASDWDAPLAGAEPGAAPFGEEGGLRPSPAQERSDRREGEP